MRHLPLLLQVLGLAGAIGLGCNVRAAWSQAAPVVIDAPAATAPAVDVRLEAPAPQKVAPTPVAAPEQPLTIVLESRSTGCRTQGDSAALTKLQSNLCQRPASLPPRSLASAQPRLGVSSVPVWFRQQPPQPDLATLASYLVNRDAKNPTSLKTFLASRTDSPTAGRSAAGEPILYPLPVPVPVTSAFGLRTHPISGLVSFHQGLDLGAPEGTPVLAALAGRVSIAEFLGGLGLAVVLDHADGDETRYGHLSQVFVQPGDWVEQGQVIGAVGSTGMSTGPHLHFEFWQNTPEGRVAIDLTQQVQLAVAQFARQLAVSASPAERS